MGYSLFNLAPSKLIGVANYSDALREHGATPSRVNCHYERLGLGARNLLFGGRAKSRSLAARDDKSLGLSLYCVTLSNQEQTVLLWQLILHPAAMRPSVTFLLRSSTTRASTSMRLPFALLCCGLTMTAPPTFI